MRAGEKLLIDPYDMTQNSHKLISELSDFANKYFVKTN